MLCANRVFWRVRRKWNMYLFLFVYTVINVWMFLHKFFYYRYQRANVFSVMGYCVCVARGCAFALKFNIALALLFALKSFSGTVQSRVFFHRVVGCVCATLATVHSLAHICDFAQLEDASVAQLNSIWPAMGFTEESKPTAVFFWTSLPGWTGIMMIACIGISCICILFKDRFFEAFLLSHQLLVFMVVLLLFHGQLGLLEPPNAHFWVAGPLLALALEKGVRFWQQSCIQPRVGPDDSFRVLNARIVGGQKDVLELTVKKPSFFKFSAGAYCLLKVPSLSWYEWHPFTIASAPEEEHLTFFIKALGDWTTKLVESFSAAIVEQSLHAPVLKCEEEGEEARQEASWPVVRIQGPEGAPAQSWYQYDVVAFISTGVGVTPYLSILKHLLYLQMESKRGNRSDVQLPNKVYFVWVCKTLEELEWAADVLHQLEENQDEANDLEIANTEEGGSSTCSPSLLSTHCFLSCDEDQLPTTRTKAAMEGFIGGNISVGKPDWVELFTDIRATCSSAVDQSKFRAGVFSTVPASLDKELENVTLSFTDSHVMFEYCSELFAN